MAAAAVLVVPGPAHAANLLTNPGFESGSLSGWSCSGGLGSVVSSPVHGGTKALAGAASASDNAKCTQTVSVQPNTAYSLTGWVRGSNVYLGVTGATSTWAASSGSYTQLTVNFTTGASQTSAEIYLHGWYGTGTYYADDISLDGPGGPGGGDTQAPTTPANFRSTAKTSTSVSLAWNAATDNVAVTGYDVYRGTTLATSVTGTTATVTGLAPSTAYGFTVRARDAAGNTSPATTTVNVTTDPGTGTGVNVPFGSHSFPYASGTIKVSGSQATNDAKVVAYYQQWKSAFLRSDCGNGWSAIASPDADHPYVAEGQGYGLTILATMAGADPDARTSFDRVLKYVLDHPSVNDADLHAAEQNVSCQSVNGSDSATDGDLEIAYALLLADRQWGSTTGTYHYKDLAVRRINAIERSEIVSGTNLTNLGDWSSGSYDTISRTSDWLPGHFRAFRKATGDAAWDTIRDRHQSLIASLQSQYAPNTGLLPDFVQDTTSNPRPAVGQVLESPLDGSYSWNACRDPWRIGVDALTTGDSRSLAAVRKMNTWIKQATGGNPNNIQQGYRLDGTVAESGSSVAFIAPFAVAAAADSGSQAWLDALWNKLNATPLDSGSYYGSSIQLQVMIAVTGNHWLA
ncbi:MULTISPECIES: glycosyl hydrolase family 8 [unclassified Streptomyces]|uniref:glycosyl hydrolase family 8 n=1 Tax=unclassified Streptomyces TaxID=2593676 RepID=UPI0021C7C355|nr:glycosyl hydrolase family 8 [Streptomyces sp. FIT100]UUN30673.1 carbohydrate binding domain-containing protein [Streptomyces sp. FIT100]